MVKRWYGETLIYCYFALINWCKCTSTQCVGISYESFQHLHGLVGKPDICNAENFIVSVSKSQLVMATPLRLVFNHEKTYSARAAWPPPNRLFHFTNEVIPNVVVSISSQDSWFHGSFSRPSPNSDFVMWKWIRQLEVGPRFPPSARAKSPLYWMRGDSQVLRVTFSKRECEIEVRVLGRIAILTQIQSQPDTWTMGSRGIDDGPRVFTSLTRA